MSKLPLLQPGNESDTAPAGTQPASGPSRRQLLKSGALALTAAGTASLVPAPLTESFAEHVHQEIAATPAGAYQPQAFLPHEWQTLRVLAEMIVPADEVSGSALDAKAPEFIDLLASNNDRLKTIFTSGFLWLDHEMTERANHPFRTAPEADRHALLHLLADNIEEGDAGYPSYVESVDYQRFEHYTTDPGNPVAHGLRFFGWARRLVVDAFYTTPMGVADVGFEGNKFLRTYEVPKEPMEYVKAKRAATK